jgi:hypothetical protein
MEPNQIVPFLNLVDRGICTRVNRKWRKCALETAHTPTFSYYFFFSEIESNFFASLNKNRTIHTKNAVYRFFPSPHPNFQSYHFSIKVQSTYYYGKSGLLNSEKDVGIFIGKNVWFDDSPHIFWTGSDNPTESDVARIILQVFQYIIDKFASDLSEKYTLERYLTCRMDNSQLMTTHFPYILQKHISMFDFEASSVRKFFFQRFIHNSIHNFPKYFAFDPDKLTIQRFETKIVSRGFVCMYDVKLRIIKEYQIDLIRNLVDGPFEWTQNEMETRNKVRKCCEGCWTSILDVPLTNCYDILRHCLNRERNEYSEIE